MKILIKLKRLWLILNFLLHILSLLWAFSVEFDGKIGFLLVLCFNIDSNSFVQWLAWGRNLFIFNFCLSVWSNAILLKFNHQEFQWANKIAVENRNQISNLFSFVVIYKLLECSPWRILFSVCLRNSWSNSRFVYRIVLPIPLIMLDYVKIK